MIDFGLVDAVDAEAIGLPGQRTFRVRARSGDSYAALWLEKEQLAQLGRICSQLIADRSRQRGRPPVGVEPVGNFPQTPQVDLHVARMGLDFDTENDRIVILADDAQALERGDSPAFRMEVNRSQALALIQIIERTVAAGRPLCPLCHEPLEYVGQQHFCPHTNGHSKTLDVPTLEDDEDEEEDGPGGLSPS